MIIKLFLKFPDQNIYRMVKKVMPNFHLKSCRLFASHEDIVGCIAVIFLLPTTVNLHSIGNLNTVQSRSDSPSEMVTLLLDSQTGTPLNI